MKRIYIAGQYSADNVIDVLANINKGIEWGAMLLSRGYAVFCPFLDHHFALTAYGAGISKTQFQANSMAWVEVSDAVFIIPGSRISGGVQREIDRAKELRIPVYFSFDELQAWADSDRTEIREMLEHCY